MRNTPLKQHDLPTEARTVHPSHEPVKDDDTSVALSPDTPPLILFDDHPTQEPGPQMDVPSHTHPRHPMNPVPPSIPESGHHSPRRHDIPSEDQPNEALTQFKILNNVLRNRFNLTNLEIDPSISTDTFRLILSRTPSLRSINVKLKSISSSGPKSGYPMLDHPSLEELTINTTVHPGQLLTSLCLPRLSQFSLNAHKGTFAREEEIGLYKLLRTSQCFLSSLSLVDVYPRQSELIHCLLHRTCQTLQILKVCSTISPLVATTFRRRCIMNPTIKVLGDTTTTGEPLICPRLLLLELSHCDASNDLFAEMVKTRVGAGPLSLGYAFRSPSPQFDAAIREKLAAIRTPYPFRFRSMFTHVITKDISI
ncbi:hypothetical protein H0H93_002764 [Arthromyces matolae]|nr:hypothetical protein H0H93_002764 [Arthromyces matolae]